MVMNSYVTFHDLWIHIWIHVYEEYREIIPEFRCTKVPDAQWIHVWHWQAQKDIALLDGEDVPHKHVVANKGARVAVPKPEKYYSSSSLCCFRSLLSLRMVGKSAACHGYLDQSSTAIPTLPWRGGWPSSSWSVKSVSCPAKQSWYLQHIHAYWQFNLLISQKMCPNNGNKVK